MMQREWRGQIAYAAGHAAEDQVARHYARAGYAVIERRWRGAAGEIDLVCSNGQDVVFVEVKKSKSLAFAALRVSRRQMERIYATASEFLGGMPDGQLTPCRFDVGLVDDAGQIEVIENAFGAV